MMDHTSKVSPLKERASIELAINLCQDNSFKEAALRLEKPTYGHLLPGKNSIFVTGDLVKFYGTGSFRDIQCQPYVFVSDPKDYSIWTDKMKECPYEWFVDEQKGAALENECQRLIEKLPYLLRDRVRVWINRIALEYLSYRSRLEGLFGVSRYFLMTIFSIGDWKETGRLDETKVALRLLDDERLTVFQKYQIACVYCLHEHIPGLWKRLTRDEVSLIMEDLELLRERIRSSELMPYKDYKTHISVLLWSYQMELDEKDKLTESELWTHAVRQATYYGNRAALALCWEKLNEQTRQQIVIDMALISIKECDKKVSFNLYGCIVKESWPYMASAEFAKDMFNLSCYYGELVLFFLSQMDEEKKLIFFQRTIAINYYILKCFLDWPLQHELLGAINRLWEMITKDNYQRCLYILRSSCYTGFRKENHLDDYLHLFWKLWETAPEEFKLFAFQDDTGPDLLYFLLLRGFFQKDDEVLFKQGFCDQTPRALRKLMHSKEGEYFCLILLSEENLSFLNWLLEKCLSKDEFLRFKKKLIKSELGCMRCIFKLVSNRENFVESVINWCFDTDAEKSQFKHDLIDLAYLHPKLCKYALCHCLCERDFDKVERMIYFCVSSDEKKKEIKADFALYFCKMLLEKYESGADDEISIVGATTWEQMDKILASSIVGATIWEQMDKILSWSLTSDEKVRSIKKHLFEKAINLHFKIVFINREWEEVERFYKWFDLSPVEIKDLKHTIFNPDLILKIQNNLLSAEVLVAPLRWCLTDEETVIRFKKTIEESLCDLKESEAGKERLNYLVSELLCGLRVEENQDETSREGTFVKQIAEKRSVEIEDESSSSYKQFM